MFSRSIRSLSAAALALTGATVLASSAQAAAPSNEWRVNTRFTQSPLLHLIDVAGSNTRSAWVVGSFCSLPCFSPTPASYHWNGKGWTAAGITANQVDGLSTVSTSGPANTWAFGHKATPKGRVSRSVHWDGRTWAAADLPNVGQVAPLISRSVTLSAKDTWAFGGLPTGGSAAYLAHFDGKRWKRVTAPKKLKPGSITEAVALSRKDIWALVLEGQTYDVVHYDGRSWSIVKTPADFTPRGGLVVRSKNDIWLGGGQPGPGFQSQSGVMHFNGKNWSFAPVGMSRLLITVTDDGQGGLWALTANSPSEIWHNVKGQWWKATLANTINPNINQLSHIPGSSTTLGIGTDISGPAIFVTGRF